MVWKILPTNGQYQLMFFFFNWVSHQKGPTFFFSLGELLRPLGAVGPLEAIPRQLQGAGWGGHEAGPLVEPRSSPNFWGGEISIFPGEGRQFFLGCFFGELPKSQFVHGILDWLICLAKFFCRMSWWRRWIQVHRGGANLMIKNYRKLVTAWSFLRKLHSTMAGNEFTQRRLVEMEAQKHCVPLDGSHRKVHSNAFVRFMWRSYTHCLHMKKIAACRWAPGGRKCSLFVY